MKTTNEQLVAEISTVTIDRANGVRYSPDTVSLGECGSYDDILRGIERHYGLPIVSYLDYQPHHGRINRLSDGRQIVLVDRRG
jgi:hypothetical protein